jgi:hypothetical protein
VRTLGLLAVLGTIGAFPPGNAFAFYGADPPPPGILPANYRQLIVQELRANFTEARDGMISAPAVNWGGLIKPSGQIARVCVAFTAKGMFGGDRRTVRLFFFSDGRLAQSSTTTAATYDVFCRNLKYSPFPQLKKVR